MIATGSAATTLCEAMKVAYQGYPASIWMRNLLARIFLLLDVHMLYQRKIWNWPQTVLHFTLSHACCLTNALWFVPKTL